MHDTIGFIGIRREEVKEWGISELPPANLRARRIILNTALTPREATADWRKTIDRLGTETIKNGLEGLSIIEADTEDEEATAIALEMRQSLDEQGQTCALITPSSDIARRVASKMQKFFTLAGQGTVCTPTVRGRAGRVFSARFPRPEDRHVRP